MEKLIAQFQVEVFDKAIEIDPTNELDWYSITVGWALAKGLEPNKAIDFAIHIRYETDLG
jgi:hypothetical protein